MLERVDMTVSLLIVANIFFSIGVIFANKHLFQDLGFHYSATLTGFHFVATTAFSYGLHVAKWETYNPLDMRSIIILSVSTCISIWFQNFSLLLNTVDFYQVTKLAVIPFTVVLQWLLYRIDTSTSVKLALSILTVGVGVATVTAIELNLTGLVVALVGVATTSFQQIIYSSLMKDKKMNGVQLYYNIGPLSACLMIAGGLLVDKYLQGGVSFFDADLNTSVAVRGLVKPLTAIVYTICGQSESVGLFRLPWTDVMQTWIVTSCLLAAPMNFSSAMMLAKTSAVTFQVVGHTKTIIIWLLGIVIFASAVSPQSTVGFLIAMAGVIWYTQLKLDEVKPKAAAVQPPPPPYTKLDISDAAEDDAGSSDPL